MFVGVGISAFYEAPKRPETPALIKYCPIEKINDENTYGEFRRVQDAFDQEEKAYESFSKIYNRNVSIIALSFAVAILIISFATLKRLYLISDGLLLGGVLTLVYSIVCGFNSQDNMFRFFVVAVGLAISLVLGYIKFIKTKQKRAK
jgi:hypothetical protein